ncbi:hypothetical protein [Exiguobacterium sp.]|uniref:hypothetical protein n=1 Tax=Exiguobacterium sp. TaxID=44751 RepID=UPI0028AB2E5A|nr:hypothetical protein [Exiguobacterium sp.]
MEHDFLHDFDSSTHYDHNNQHHSANDYVQTHIESHTNHGTLHFNDIVNHSNPLSVAHEYKVPSLDLSQHYVKPHWVNGYFTSEGTYVKGYFRDGDGDTSRFDGDGYWSR